jgi:hypothetical protein
MPSARGARGNGESGRARAATVGQGASGMARRRRRARGRCARGARPAGGRRGRAAAAAVRGPVSGGAAAEAARATSPGVFGGYEWLGARRDGPAQRCPSGHARVATEGTLQGMLRGARWRPWQGRRVHGATGQVRGAAAGARHSATSAALSRAPAACRVIDRGPLAAPTGQPGLAANLPHLPHRCPIPKPWPLIHASLQPHPAHTHTFAP